MLVKIGAEKKNVKYSGEAKGLLKRLGIQKETVIVAKNGKIVPESEQIGEDDEVELIKVIFGG